MNIRYTGIESWKYGLTARWYGSEYYGNDADVDSVGYFHPTTNPAGHGGPLRPFSTLGKFYQDATIAQGSNIVLDSGFYTNSIAINKPLTIIGDGSVTISNASIFNGVNSVNSFYNTTVTSCSLGSINTIVTLVDCNVFYSSIATRSGVQYIERCNFIESSFGSNWYVSIKNSTFISCSGTIGTTSSVFENILIINSPNLIMPVINPRPTGVYKDYSVIIGGVKTSVAVNGKTTGVTVEDFKIDGNYFIRSFSEVDVFGNASGSGASVAQLQTLFNNYFSPIYLDTWQFADLSLKPTASAKLRYGGLNGNYIGSRPVGYHFNAAMLWAARNVSNTSDIEIDGVTGYLQIAGTPELGILETNELNLGAPYVMDPILFRANLVYNADGTAKQGVANQRIDATPDLLPNNTLNQRVVYDYQMAYAADASSPLSEFKNFELNRKPTVDATGNTQLDDGFNQSSAQSIMVWRFKLRVTLRKIIIS